MYRKLAPGLLVVTVLAAGFSRAVCEDIQNPPKSLPRFHQVAPGFYRGGQPRDGGYQWLKQQGIKTIINLRGEHDEGKQIESLGFSYVYLPMRAGDEISASAIQTFLETVSDPARQPVFIHCRRGADRTGFMVGIYRIAKQGWSAEKAYDEARDIGMHWWWRGLKRQLFEFAEEVHGGGSAAAGK